MSIIYAHINNALSNAALARRHDFEPAHTVPLSFRDIALAAGAPPSPIAGKPGGGQREGGAAGASPTAAGSNATNTALQTLTTYIPTEVLTLYLAAVAAPSSCSGVVQR